MSNDNAVSNYWLAHYASDVCDLCGNWGVLDTRGTRTPAGTECGKITFCICPNGQSARGLKRDPVEINKHKRWSHAWHPFLKKK